MNEMITVVSFAYAHEAYVIRSKLESEGILCEIKNEHTLQVHNFLSHAVGGVQLQVRRIDFERALTIIRDAGLEPDRGESNPLLKRLVNVTRSLPFGKQWHPLTKAFVSLGLILALIVTAFVSYVYVKGPDSTASEAHIISKINQEKHNAMHLFRANPDDAAADENSFENPERALAQVLHYRNEIQLKVLPREKAVALYHLGSYQLALVEFNRYLSTHGSHIDPSVYYNMGLCYRNQSMLDSAFLFFQLAYENLNSIIPNTADQNGPAIAISSGKSEYYWAQLYCLIHSAELMGLQEKPYQAMHYYTLARNRAQDCSISGFDCKGAEIFAMNMLERHQNKLNPE